MNYYPFSPRGYKLKMDVELPQKLGYINQNRNQFPQIGNLDLKKDWISQSIVRQLSTEISQKLSLVDLAYQFQISPTIVAKRIWQLDSLQKSNLREFSLEMDINPDSEQFRILEDNLAAILKNRENNGRLDGRLDEFPLLDI
ncbi:hypothetical protein [Pedobacter hiemivivus]|uniref:Uncharacterized protein n=1 Tax=Pedobacter hiemivivus TaxID=2530454 RepID=A0A4R0NFC6_9SPHI|nr:hypothetical protein [Pedobacter hiemivivus]TCC99161.1 hypothetical protein EZ444_00305 [Pedobacter hiemivivus]